MKMKDLMVISEALRVTYLRGTRDPSKQDMTKTITEMRQFIVNELKHNATERQKI